MIRVHAVVDQPPADRPPPLPFTAARRHTRRPRPPARAPQAPPARGAPPPGPAFANALTRNARGRARAHLGTHAAHRRERRDPALAHAPPGRLQRKRQPAAPRTRDAQFKRVHAAGRVVSSAIAARVIAVAVAVAGAPLLRRRRAACDSDYVEHGHAAAASACARARFKNSKTYVNL